MTTTEIQAQIDASPDGDIHLPGGSHDCRDWPLRIRKPFTRLHGNGWGTTIHARGDGIIVGPDLPAVFKPEGAHFQEWHRALEPWIDLGRVQPQFAWPVRLEYTPTLPINEGGQMLLHGGLKLIHVAGRFQFGGAQHPTLIQAGNRYVIELGADGYSVDGQRVDCVGTFTDDPVILGSDGSMAGPGGYVHQFASPWMVWCADAATDGTITRCVDFYGARTLTARRWTFAAAFSPFCAVENLQISGGYHGVHAWGAVGLRVANVFNSGQQGNCVRLAENCFECTIRDCRSVGGAGYAILNASGFTSMHNCHVTAARIGLHVIESSVSVHGGSITSNGETKYGILATGHGGLATLDLHGLGMSDEPIIGNPSGPKPLAAIRAVNLNKLAVFGGLVESQFSPSLDLVNTPLDDHGTWKPFGLRMTAPEAMAQESAKVGRTRQRLDYHVSLRQNREQKNRAKRLWEPKREAAA